MIQIVNDIKLLSSGVWKTYLLFNAPPSLLPACLLSSLPPTHPEHQAHYWDYTRELTEGLEWYESPMFDEEWFGSNSPNNKEHVVDSGRFAYTPVMKDARAYSKITNPYGLLRSPWNTNPTPYVTRYNRTFFNLGDAYLAFPSCSAFAAYVNGSSFSAVSSALDGELHGPVHLMVGGHWGAKNDWKALGENIGEADDKMLLMSKVMWREGFIRLPVFCSEGTPQSECMPSCPAHIISPNGEALTESRAIEILEKVNVFHFWESLSDLKTILEKDTGGTLNFKMLLEELCHFGNPGELFTSAAPQDPLFWSLHGNSERFVQYLRVLKAKAMVAFDETCGYSFSGKTASETGRICDWSEVKDAFTMPNCTWGTCPGHREEDLLPFTHLFEGQGGKLLSNAELYAFTSPFNEDLTYAYDSMGFWKGCANSSLLVEAGL